MQSPIVQSYPACSDASTWATCWSSRSGWTNGSASPATAWACTRRRPNAACIALRIDAHARRLIVREGPAEDVIAIGWQLDDDACPAAGAGAPARRRAFDVPRRAAAKPRAARRRAVLGLRWAEAAALRAVHAAAVLGRPARTCRPAASSPARGAWATSRSPRASRKRRCASSRTSSTRGISDTIDDRLNGIDSRHDLPALERPPPHDRDRGHPRQAHGSDPHPDPPPEPAGAAASTT